MARLAANSLLLYLGGRPGDLRGLVLWLEPTWHCYGPAGVLAGSRQAQEEGEEHRQLAEVLAAALVGRKVSSAAVEPRTNDLHVSFERDYGVKTFVADPADDHTWHIADYDAGVKVYASPSGLKVFPVRKGRPRKRPSQ